MLHSMISLFALISSSSASRRLLDETTPFFPAQQGPPGPPGTLVPDTNPPDVTPASGNVNPVYGDVRPVMLPLTLPPLPGNGAGPKLEQQCTLKYDMIGSCAGNPNMLLSNPAENFKMDCSATGACAQSTITLDYASGGMVRAINKIEFSEAFAGWGTTIVINNQQGGNTIKLENLGCTVTTACQDMTVILNNADVGDIDCPYPDYCTNCFVKVGPLDPNPTPCFGW